MSWWSVTGTTVVTRLGIAKGEISFEGSALVTLVGCIGCELGGLECTRYGVVVGWVEDG